MEYKLYRILNPDCAASLCIPLINRYMPSSLTDVILNFVTRIDLRNVPPVYNTRRMKLGAYKYDIIHGFSARVEHYDSMSIELLHFDGNFIRYVPKEDITQKLCDIAIEHGASLEYIPQKFLQYHMYFTAVSNNGLMLKHVPRKYITTALCLEAVSNNGEALQFVPIHIKSRKICTHAVITDGMAIKYVPCDLLTEEMKKMAVKSNGKCLPHIQNPSKDLILEALRTFRITLCYIWTF